MHQQDKREARDPTAAAAVPSAETSGLAIYHIPPHLLPSPDKRAAFFARVAAMGFDVVLLGWPFPVTEGTWFSTLTLDRTLPALGGDSPDKLFNQLAAAAGAHGLALHVDLACTAAGDGDLVDALPGCWSAISLPYDPRTAPAMSGHRVMLDEPQAAVRFAAFWQGHVQRWREAGIQGVRCHDAGSLSVDVWNAMLSGVRGSGLVALAWTPGLRRAWAREIAHAFDFVTSSVAWWDGRAPWLVQEYEELRPHGRLLAFPEDPFGSRLAPRGNRSRHLLALRAAAFLSDAWLMPAGFEFGADAPFMESQASLEAMEARTPFDLSSEIAAVNADRFDITALRMLSRPGEAATLVQTSGPAGDRLIALNPDPSKTVAVSVRTAAMPYGLTAEGPACLSLSPGEATCIRLAPTRPVILPRPPVAPAAAAPRIAIEQVSPTMEGGRFAVKRCVGDVVTVEADILADGHEQLAAEVRWRAGDTRIWQRASMAHVGNDRWRAAFPLERIGPHEFLVEAWWDRFGTFRHDFRKKRDAGRLLAIEIEEGRSLLETGLETAPSGTRRIIREHLQRLRRGDAAEALLSEELAAAMLEAEPRAFAAGAGRTYRVDSDREAARYASWYELFPRSATDTLGRHGTFQDVIRRLPAIRAMGFDVLYFPPIHPIGRTHRKGRNNALTAGPDDPGSPYAIGSEAGGHEAIHPELGTFEDFRALIAAARAHGLEIALDFAIQCAPDHPWLKAHPEWFRWRPDGTVRYAENPPKTYEDIVNVDFYAEGAVPQLWVALRDIVEGWVHQGVRIFRVDNPHTKPFPFWEWLIADIRSRDPGVIFLAEAFTRPKVMYRLGKVGFTQSYTYFTWRNTKNEIEEYINELNSAPAREIYRPHFFVNTPDINPYFLQRSGRPGFLIRAVLAATLSGLWGVYSGFELCEAEPVPGKEEYLHSEKYEIRPRDYAAPGNIVPQITQLNAIRRAHPALQTHLGTTFYNAFDAQVLYFGRRIPDASEMVLVAVNLDPHAARTVAIEVPLWAFGLPDHAAVEVEDLLRDHCFTWVGKMQTIQLDPADLPYAIWRIRPTGGAA